MAAGTSWVSAAMMSSTATAASQPPVAKKIPKVLETHGHQRVDNYFWMNERDSKDVLSYLNKENKYAEGKLKPVQELQEELYKEMTSRLDPKEESVPYQKNGYMYYSRFEPGANYPLYLRKASGGDGKEEVVIDAVKESEGHAFFSLTGIEVSPNNKIAAYHVDTVSRRLYDLKFKDLATGKDYPEVIRNTGPGVAWANDSNTVYYVRKDPDTLREYQLYRHTLGTDPADDELVYEEKDTEFLISVSKSKSGKYIILGSYQTLSHDFFYLSADTPKARLHHFLPREKNHEYFLNHIGDYFYVLTNKGAKNFRLVRTDKPSSGPKCWETVVPHREDVLLEHFELFNDFVAVEERENANAQIRVLKHDGSNSHVVNVGEDAFTASLNNNKDPSLSTVRFRYTSMVTPDTIYDYDVKTQELTKKKQDKVLGYDAKQYTSKRVYAKARDGTTIPVTLSWKKDKKADGPMPLLLQGYGSYGLSFDPEFTPWAVSLLDRGFIHAVAHIRGGQEKGRSWYEQGKMFHKWNTFNDYIDAAKFLDSSGISKKDWMFARGGSAGGLLMGAVLNSEPLLFRGMISKVPFVDVVTTMLDDTVPLTTFEYDEWGNPNIEAQYKYMLSYSPYDNVEAKDYTNLLVMTGYHDSQVQYWEPAKYVAKLRELKTDKNQLLFLTNMEAGHGGASGRLRRYKELATEVSFILGTMDGTLTNDEPQQAKKHE